MEERLTEMRCKTEYIVAKKGVKGFHKSNIIDSKTSVWDYRVEKTTSLFNAVIAVVVEKKPIRFSHPGHYGKNVAIPKTEEVIFKFAEFIKTELSNKFGETVYEVILVDNYNKRYHVVVSESFAVCTMREIQEPVVTVSDKKTRVGKVINLSQYRPKRRKSIPRGDPVAGKYIYGT
jgi:hypothetical protein